MRSGGGRLTGSPRSTVSWAVARPSADAVIVYLTGGREPKAKLPSAAVATAMGALTPAAVSTLVATTRAPRTGVFPSTT